MAGGPGYPTHHGEALGERQRRCSPVVPRTLRPCSHAERVPGQPDETVDIGLARQRRGRNRRDDAAGAGACIVMSFRADRWRPPRTCRARPARGTKHLFHRKESASTRASLRAQTRPSGNVPRRRPVRR